MRGNSGFLSWLPSLTCPPTSYSRRAVLFAMTLTFLAVSSHAGLITARHRRMMREVYANIDANNQTELQPDAGTCFLDGVQVPENTVHCDKKPGCRVIQKTGSCCPDYQCECERDGKIYSNGEKLTDPNTPCRVCFCQGGEIVCSNVSCYKRSDCQPKFIMGRCCPEYDNCPPLEPNFPAISQETVMEAQPTTTSLHGYASNTFSTVLKEEAAKNNPLGIKIKEITKPEEIRIIDDKPKQIFSVVKPMDNGNSNQAKVALKKISSQSVIDESSLNDMRTSLDGSSSQENNSSSSTANETVNKLEATDEDAINNEDSQKTVRHTSADTGVNYTEESEDEEKKGAASEIGKEVVIIDNNGHSKPITIFGTEGLQRGDVTVESVDNSTSSEAGYDMERIEDLEIAASSTNDVRVLPTDGSSKTTTSEMNPEDISASPSVIYETVLYTSKPEIPEDDSRFTGIILNKFLEDRENETVPLASKKQQTKISTSSHHYHYMEDDDATSNEPNPAYPNIEEDLSNYGRDEHQSLAEDYAENNNSKAAVQGLLGDDPRASHSQISTEGSNSFEILENSTTDGSYDPTESFLRIKEFTSGEVMEFESSSTMEFLTKELGRHEDFTEAEPDGSGFDPIKREGSVTYLKSIPPMEEIEISFSEPTVDGSMSIELMKDDPNMASEVLEFNSNENNNTSTTGVLLKESFKKAIDTMYNFRKGYLNIF